MTLLFSSIMSHTMTPETLPVLEKVTSKYLAQRVDSGFNLVNALPKPSSTTATFLILSIRPWLLYGGRKALKMIRYILLLCRGYGIILNKLVNKQKLTIPM